jgi:hypothetical protein
MDMLLLAITIISLLLALFMGVAAWGMWREERARSAARIASLAAAAASGEQPADDAVITPAARAVPAAPPASAPKAAPWSAPADWRRLPKAEPREQAAPAATAPVPDALGDRFLGSAVATPASGGRQRGLAIAASVLFVAVVTAGYFTIDAGDGGGSTTAAAADSKPLELISLRHERDKGMLAIAGLVRNPSNSARVEKLDAVVFLFNHQGEFVTSSRAGVDFTQLAPGDESPFVVRLDAPANVARYRVSFRTDAGVVPHVDRRGQEPIARELP